MRYFDNAKVGDKVTDLKFGDGEIIDIGRTTEYITVRFIRDNFINGSFSFDGRHIQVYNQTLFYRGGVEVVVKPVERMVEKTVEVYANLYTTYTPIRDIDSPFIGVAYKTENEAISVRQACFKYLGAPARIVHRYREEVKT